MEASDVGALEEVSLMRCTLVVAAVLLGSCATRPDPPKPLPPNSFAFAVFGDGPYYFPERGRFRRVIEDVNESDVEWFLHVGDIMWARCSDRTLASRLDMLRTIRHPVVYTPGDNEWTDCHQKGGFQPLDRLQHIRSTYFASPSRSVAGPAMAVESQSANPAWKEFVENARWRRGRFLFVTIHMVGSENATRRFRGRGPADDSAVVRRTAAALDWLDAAFSIATTDSLSGVVIAIHANPRFDNPPRNPYASFVGRLRDHTSVFKGQVLFIHGGTHQHTVDHPMKRADTGAVLDNFTRLETFGSPDIGWVRVVVDSVAGRVVEIEPRLMRGGFL
jgi:hypothetical protein